MITITRKFEFDAAHRIMGHEGKCRHLHGHHYVAEVTIQGPSDLNKLSMVADFGILKKLIGDWINERWDHNILLSSDDPLAKLWHTGTVDVFQGKLPFIFPSDNQPTAEVMAYYLAYIVQALIQSGTEPGRLLSCIHVRVYETPNCWADWRVDSQLFTWKGQVTEGSQGTIHPVKDIMLEEEEDDA